MLARFANRLVYGRRATPYEVLSEFSERVGDTYADEDVLPRMARVLGEGIGAERADVWLAVDRELRDVAAWPGDVEPPWLRSRLPNGSVPAIAASTACTRSTGGRAAGRARVRKPASDPMTPADEKLVDDLAAKPGWCSATSACTRSSSCGSTS